MTVFLEKIDYFSNKIYYSNNINLLDMFVEGNKLTFISLPINNIQSYTFNSCISLQSANFPQCTSINNFAFEYCSSLQLISLPQCTTISSYAFRGCTSLQAVYLLASSVCKLSNSNAFSSTPIQRSSFGLYGSIYVPSSLVSSYKTATNWTYYSSRITAFEG